MSSGCFSPPPLEISCSATIGKRRRTGVPKSGWYLTTRECLFDLGRSAERLIEYYDEDRGWSTLSALHYPSQWAKIEL